MNNYFISEIERNPESLIIAVNRTFGIVRIKIQIKNTTKNIGKFPIIRVNMEVKISRKLFGGVKSIEKRVKEKNPLTDGLLFQRLMW